MHSRSLALVLLALTIAGSADAQRRGGVGGMGGMGRGGMGRRGGGEGGRGADLVLPEAGDFRKLNPAGLIVDNRRKLKLTDAQVGTLSTLRDKSREGNETILTHYDSVRKEVRTALANRRNQQRDQSDTTRGAALDAMRTMRFLLDSLSARRDADVKEVLAVFTDDAQRQQAARLLDDQELAFQEKLPRLGRGGRRGGEPD